MVAEAWIGLGSNLGDRRAHLRAAVAALERLGKLTGVSSLYETEPVGYKDQGAFLNAVAGLETAMPARALMAELLRIEAEQGRIRDRRDGPRTLDLDLLLYNGSIIAEPELEVPHPRLHLRRFVLEPLCELAPDLRHPGLNRTVRQMLEETTDQSEVARVQAYPDW
jgi:2-amino-4-hydroxy-6-hydroxymethyldihydropteridine diphosphokinase